MCSVFTPDRGYDNINIIVSGDVYYLNTKCSGKLCLHKETFQALGRSDYQCPQCASVCQVRKILFEDQTNCLFYRLAMAFTFLKRVSIQHGIGDVYCPVVLASIVPTERNTNLFAVM